MRSLRKHLMEIRVRLSPQKRVLLLMDFDGTLSPLAGAPEKAHLPQNVQQMLLRLALQPRVRVAILSGRPLDYLKAAFGARSFFYGGNHGLEMEGPDFSFRHPGARALRNVIQNLVRQFRRPIQEVSGALLENKGLSLALHYRNVPRAHRPDFDALVEKLQNKTAGLPVRWRPGNKVWELLPRVAWDKGRAAQALIRHLEHPFPVAVGDDKTDEDMFEALSGKGITVHVGDDGDSFAQFCLARQSEVPRFLKFLEEVLK
jgi:trehalose 6-phosphate phosphatase